MLIGLVGKPSCGKSTFFKAATLADVLIASYPFATIKPNRGIGYVRVKALCSELGVKCNPRTGFCDSKTRFVPVELMDVAGLVKGANQGKGLGNQFLDDLRQADAFIHIVDISGTTDDEGKECEPNSENPIKDITMLEDELNKWYTGILKKVWNKFSKTLQTTKQDFPKAVAKQFSGLKVKEEDIKQILLKLNLDTEVTKWNDKNLEDFASGLRKLTKPMVVAANKIDKPSGKQNLDKLKKQFPDLTIIPCSADSELALREAGNSGLIEYTPGENKFTIHNNKTSKKQKQALKTIKQNVLDIFNSTGVQYVLDFVVFDLLHQIAVFPAGRKLKDSKGNVLPDCYLIPETSTALDFAYLLHTDLGEKFIKAIDVRTKQPVGKNHPLKHRDCLEIITN